MQQILFICPSFTLALFEKWLSTQLQAFDNSNILQCPKVPLPKFSRTIDSPSEFSNKGVKFILYAILWSKFLRCLPRRELWGNLLPFGSMLKEYILEFQEVLLIPLSLSLNRHRKSRKVYVSISALFRSSFDGAKRLCVDQLGNLYPTLNAMLLFQFSNETVFLNK